MGKVLQTVSNGFSKVGFGLKKYGPDILVGAGIIGLVASAILACRATIKAKPVVEDHKNKVKDIRDKFDNAEGQVDERGRDKEITKTYLKTGLEFAKLYGPSILLGSLSIFGILGSHKILTDRNMATAAAYTALSETFSAYRKKVADKIGSDKEKEVYAKQKGEEILAVMNKESEETQDEKRSKRPKKKGYSVYARFFDCGNHGWEDNPTFTLTYLRMAENFFNDRLEARGYLFLNEVYKTFGYQETQDGQVVGWIYDPKIPRKINFGIYSLDLPYDELRAKSDFLDGIEPVIILDFNVDGVILNKLPKE